MRTETAKRHLLRQAEGFYSAFLSGAAILDIGFQGSSANSVPVTENAIGVDLGYPGYDGVHLPFPSSSQDTVFASHCLEHILDYKSVIGEWYRVLKTGGYLIIAVPHRDLYERKATLPSRFNTDHKRFYTPASLLAEIEESLPAGAYRIRSLKDVDDEFDYALLPTQHAVGSYEIELVLQKITSPDYANQLRPTLLSTEYTNFYAALLCKSVPVFAKLSLQARAEIVSFLQKQPLPPFAELQRSISQRISICDEHVTRTVEKAVREVLTEVILAKPFDDARYIEKYADVAAAISQGEAKSGHGHYARCGYFEGRWPTQE